MLRLGVTRGLLCVALWLAGLSVFAQETASPPSPAPEPSTSEAGTPAGALNFTSPVVTIDRDRLFAESKMGKAMVRRIEAQSEDLIAENRRLEVALEDEERRLTASRQVLPADEFRVLAEEFDGRVEELRQAQDAKSRALTRQQEADRQTFFEAAVPVLANMMAEIGAVAIIDRSAVILIFDQLDITDAALARLDQELGEGPAAAPVPQATDTTPAP